MLDAAIFSRERLRVVRLWDAVQGTQRREWGLRGTPVGMAFSPDGRTLAVSLERKLNTERAFDFFHAPDWQVDSHPLNMQELDHRLAYSPTGKQMVSVGPAIRVRELATGGIESISPADYRLNRLALSADGSFLAVGGINDLRLIPLARRCPRWGQP